MARDRSPLRIAVNVMRARLTLVGFSLAIVTFRLGAVRSFAGGVYVAGHERTVHLSADVVLLWAFVLSIAAMVLVLAAGGLAPVGVVDHPAIVGGDLCTYLALAQSVSGFSTPIIPGPGEVLTALAVAPLPQDARFAGVVLAGGARRAMAFYLGPLESLLRSPFAVTTDRVLAAISLVWVACIATLNGLSASAVSVTPVGDHAKADLAASAPAA